MWELMAGMEEALPGVRVAFQRSSPTEDNDMGIAILTPVMSRVHAGIFQTAEIMLVDTTSHIDLLYTSVTLMLTWSSVGALPLGVLLTDCQTERAYKQGDLNRILFIVLFHL